MKADMHIHTYYSDGELSPSAVVSRRKKEGYDVIAVTDHDTVDGVPEAVSAGLKEGIRVIPGIEISTEYKGFTEIHMLGYGMDIEHPRFVSKLRELRKARDDRNEKLIKLLNQQGYGLTYEELTKGKKGNYIGKPDFGRALVRMGFIEKPADVFTPGKYLEAPEAKKIRKVKMDTGDAVKLIIDAGGIPVLAHPIQIKHIGEKGSREFYLEVEKIIVELMEYGLMGMECYHLDHTPENSLRFVEIAKKYNLIRSIGSDFHGDDIKGNFVYPENPDICIDNIMEKL